jgi:hypothetical protein
VLVAGVAAELVGLTRADAGIGNLGAELVRVVVMADLGVPKIALMVVCLGVVVVCLVVVELEGKKGSGSLASTDGD